MAEPADLVEEQGLALLEIARRDPLRRVNQYPEWTMSDLLSHTSSVQRRAVLLYETLATERVPAPLLPDGIDPLDWYEEGLRSLVATLGVERPNQPVWGFGPSPDLVFWARRMAIETGLHRWDAEQSWEADFGMDPHIATLGLEEFPDMWLPRMEPLPRSRFVATDQARSFYWGEGTELSLTHEDTAGRIYLALMSRPGTELPKVWADAVKTL